jgi:hypothetical protein
MLYNSMSSPNTTPPTPHPPTRRFLPLRSVATLVLQETQIPTSIPSPYPVGALRTECPSPDSPVSALLMVVELA